MYIRVATEADIPQMHEIRMSVRENQLSDPSRIQPDDYRTLLTQRGRGWVAEVEGQVVGFAVADQERSNVWALFVQPSFEGCGVGFRLHEVMLTWFFETGAEGVWLSTSPATRAERFYRSAGWRLVGQDAQGEMRFEMSREAWIVRSTGS